MALYWLIGVCYGTCNLFLIAYKISCVLFGILIKKRYLRNVKGKVIYSSSILSQGANVNAQSVLLNVGIKREP